ncbi:hypothetical protein O6H91_07G131600 [Diphasiastrum complanatum]|uniref:Uncharacterized protein n=3 Tax=Diphasiastrum complanatum TaxID=34168 RepID=A0ACC2DA56_DIPCM|nr:hypothetical protein O6H91_07G131600 [Diphasiastrum complanatum]KAJ7551048.1 hypothetical protein O6H91_07G131600 [Diphasiastrum complanatum]
MAASSAIQGGSFLFQNHNITKWKFHKKSRLPRPQRLALSSQPLSASQICCSLTTRASLVSSEDAELDTFSRFSGYIAAASQTEAERMTIYNPQDIASVYRKRPLLLLRRLSQVVVTLGWWAGFRYLDSVLGRSESMFKKRASELRAALVKLGPAFVKIAQAVSSRPDIIPPEYLEELSLLQDRIPPFPTDMALNILEEELGVPVEIVFSEISPQPVAAASLGQVYQARLRPNGQAVAIKVQRPGVRAAIALDIFILRIFAGYLRSAARINTNLQEVVDEWGSSLFREMDYQSEANNGVRFRKLFGKLPDVKIPEIYTELTSQRVLVMEWIEGQRLAESDDLHLIQVGTYCSLSQLLDSGFYHADPHPGNLMRTSDGKLAYLDFGMMGEVNQNMRDSLIEASVHLVNREFEALAGDFVNLGLLPPNSQMSDVSRALTGVFQSAVSKGIRNLSFGDLSGNLGQTMYKFKFRLPAYFSLVVRSLTVLEGVALSKDPNYKVLGNSYPWIARKVLTDNSPQLRSTLQELLYKDGVFQVDRLQSLVTESVRPTSTYIVVAEEKIQEDEKSAYVKRILNFALSDQGEFLRSMLLDELAKELDAFNRAIFDRVAEAAGSNMPFPLPLPGPLLEGEDYQHLDNLRRLSSIISEASSSSKPIQKADKVRDNAGEKEADSNLYSMWEDVSSVATSILTSFRLVLVISELPLPAQQQALLIPAELAGKLASRVLARSIRSSVMSSTKYTWQ